MSNEYKMKQTWHDLSLDEIDHHSRCEHCNGQATKGGAYVLCLAHRGFTSRAQVYYEI